MSFPIVLLITSALLALIYLAAALTMRRRWRPPAPARYWAAGVGLLLMAAGGLFLVRDQTVGGSVWLLVGLLIVLIWSESVSPFHASFSPIGQINLGSLSHSTCLLLFLGGLTYVFVSIGCVFMLDVLNTSPGGLFFSWGLCAVLLTVHGVRRIRWEIARDDPRKDKTKPKPKRKRKNEERIGQPGEDF
jgi:hypothetical protein